MLIRKEETEEEEFNISYYCIEDVCDFEGNASDCEIEYEYNEFSGNDIPYLICPKCGGGIEY